MIRGYTAPSGDVVDRGPPIPPSRSTTGYPLPTDPANLPRLCKPF
jgi:hypothetical protein